MKVAFIIWDFPCISETFILNQVTGLLDLGVEVKIFSNNPQTGKHHSDVRKYKILSRIEYFSVPENRIIRIIKGMALFGGNFSKNHFKIIKSLNALKFRKEATSLRLFYSSIPFLRNNICSNYDVMHCHFGPYGLLGTYLRELGLFNLPIVTSFHGYDVSRIPKIYGNEYYRFLFEKGDLFTANTQYTMNKLIDMGCEKNKIIIMPEGLKIEKYKYVKRVINQEEPVQLLTIGRLVEKKGHKYAIRAISELVKRNRKIKYIIAGGGPLKNELEDLAITLGVRDHIDFTGELIEEEVIKLYAKSHVFILPSITAEDGDTEGQALVLQEAQATGLPVISTYHNGIPEGLIDRSSGFLVQEKNVSDLAHYIEILVNNPKKREEMGICGRKYIEEKYNSNTLNYNLVTAYKKICN